jgi:hypothetical protein
VIIGTNSQEIGSLEQAAGGKTAYVMPAVAKCRLKAILRSGLALAGPFCFRRNRKLLLLRFKRRSTT